MNSTGRVSHRAHSHAHKHVGGPRVSQVTRICKHLSSRKVPITSGPDRKTTKELRCEPSVVSSQREQQNRLLLATSDRAPARDYCLRFQKTRESARAPANISANFPGNQPSYGDPKKSLTIDYEVKIGHGCSGLVHRKCERACARVRQSPAVCAG